MNCGDAFLQHTHTLTRPSEWIENYQEWCTEMVSFSHLVIADITSSLKQHVPSSPRSKNGPKRREKDRERKTVLKGKYIKLSCPFPYRSHAYAPVASALRFHEAQLLLRFHKNIVYLPLSNVSFSLYAFFYIIYSYTLSFI